MSEYKVKQIQPNHADHISYYKDKYLNEMFSTEDVVAQLKYDGERMLIHINGDEVYCTSRRYSKKTNLFMENQDKIPILKEVFKNFPFKYTVLDCECYGKNWAEAVGILHSLSERAIELQKNKTLYFAVFDCLYFDGEDLRDKEYSYRKLVAENLVDAIHYKPMHMVSEFKNFVKSKDQWNKYMDTAINMGFEGIVLKSLQRKYYDKAASLKCKKFETIDCVVYDYIKGNGKYSDTVGALLIGYYDPSTDKIVHISKVNCSTDKERYKWSRNFEAMRNSVIEVKCQEITEKSLRHPVYIRLREDKDYKMCTKDTIFKETDNY